jgi:hypothetical protein
VNVTAPCWAATVRDPDATLETTINEPTRTALAPALNVADDADDMTRRR